jgi:hypothetical protein
MPLENPADFAMGDINHQYCAYCTDKKGNLLPFEQVFKLCSDYYVESQGITLEAAAKMATDLLKSQPAWKHL